MKEFVLSILLFAICITQLNAQVTAVDYQLKYNDNSCRYECYMIVQDGAASSYLDRILSSAGISIATDSACTITIQGDYNPKRDNSAGNSGTPTSWDITQFNIVDGLKHHLVVPATSPLTQFDNLTEGQEVLLFDFSLSYNLPSIQLNENPTLITGFDYNNFITIGGPADDYSGNLDIEYPTLMASFDGPSTIEVNSTTSVLPAAGGNWSSNDENIATVTNDGTVTGIDIGTAILTYDNGSDCATSLIVEVIEQQTSDTPEGDASVAVWMEGNGSQGVLLPTITQAQRENIVSPYTGLLLFQNDQVVGFYYYNGSEWKRLADM